MTNTKADAESRQTEMKDYPAHEKLNNIDAAYLWKTKEANDLNGFFINIREEFQSLLRQYQKLREAVGEWQDISSAPKDTTHILLFDGYQIDIGSYREWKEYGQNYAWYDQQCIPIEPTHWQPLPAPPTTSDKSANEQLGEK